MKKRLLTTILLTSTLFLNAQNTFTYKPNPITGKLEVLKTSQGNTAYPLKVAEIERNPISGYLEIKEFSTNNQVQQSSSDPYTNRPNFELVKQIKAFDPYTAVIEQINTLNKQREFDILQKQTATNPNIKKEKPFINDYMKNYYEEMSSNAENLLQFYNSQLNFPKKLLDGFYYTIEIKKSAIINAVNKIDPTNKVNGDKEIQVGIAKIKNNKLIEYYVSCFANQMSKESNIYRKFNLGVAGNIENCKVSFREENSNEYKSIFFFDNIIDSSIKIPDPGFGYFTLFTDNLPSDYKKPIGTYFINMGRNAKISSSASINEIFSTLSYTSGIDNNNTSNKYNCSNSNLTFAFKANEGKYTILIQNIEKRNGKNDQWYFEDITFTQGDCASSVLKTN